MKIDSVATVGVRALLAACVAVAALGLAGCAGQDSAIALAQAQVTAKEKAVTEAQSELSAASGVFCDASSDYITALDRYGDILNDTAPTVGDVKRAGSDLGKPRDAAFDGAEAAVQAHQDLVAAQKELADAQAKLERAKAGTTEAPASPAVDQPATTPLAPAATVERVKQAESEFASAQDAVTDQTPLSTASEQFNSAAVALEVSWLKLFADAGCIPDDQQAQAAAAASAYTMAIQQDLADAGYYSGAVDGVYGPETVTAVENLQKASGLAVTGTVDKATAEALQAELNGRAGAAAQESLASTAALQQTLKLAGFWDGPVDGVWTPELTEALQAFQVKLGVEPTGTVDAATITAFNAALEQIKLPAPTPEPTPEPTEG